MLHTEFRLLPPAPRLRTLLGPSFILLGLGLGSGEVILWPYLVSNYGLGVAWGALLGITFQFFINMEIERYTLAHGESVFVGLSRLSRVIPAWLIISTLLAFGWPGIIASSATLLASVFGGHGTEIAIGLLLLIGVILSIGKYIYTTVEHFSRLIIMLGIPGSPAINTTEPCTKPPPSTRSSSPILVLMRGNSSTSPLRSTNFTFDSVEFFTTFLPADFFASSPPSLEKCDAPPSANSSTNEFHSPHSAHLPDHLKK
jgi:hypothetical protein